jgi:hypothetical protein
MEIKATVEELRKRTLMIGSPLYGGQCTGSFMKSMVEFMVLATKYGLDVKPYFIYNESLITRARNYVADEFMRSGYSRLLFIDSDIGFNAEHIIHMLALQTDESEYDVLCGPYPKKCLHSSNKVITEDGVMTIGQIVNSEYRGKVKSIDSEGKVVWKKVTNHWKEKNLNKKWVTPIISDVRKRATVKVTSDHEVAVIENILSPAITFTQAENLQGKWIVREARKSKNNKNNTSSHLLKGRSLQALIGMILGDGHINKNGCYAGSHCAEQLEYNAFKANIIGGNIRIDKKGGNSLSFTNAQTKYLRNIFYPDNTKNISRVIEMLDEVALAFIYMDDGNRYYYPTVISEDTDKFTWWYNENTNETKRSEISPGEDWRRGRKDDLGQATCSIATMSFTREENEMLVNHLKNRFGIDSYVFSQKGKTKDLYGIKFDRENANKFHQIIAPFVPSCMEYKLNEEYRGGEKYVFSDEEKTEYAAELVLAVEDYKDKSSSSLYDIEVEDTHNFFAGNNILVHNCISWEKIKAAVDKGVADEDPSVLENYVGDFVFNPVFDKDKKQTTMRLDQPVEVLESGTGFMMIHRRAFEKFDACYGDSIKYKPDHVRTKNFDGSREISMYFQAEIDPETRRYLSEDYYFCQKIRKAGGKVWLAPWIALSHQGSMSFGGSLSHLASIGASATAGAHVPKR